MPHIGDLKYRATFREPTTTSQRTGQPIVTFKDVFDAWADVESLGVREQAQFRQGGMKATATLTIRFSARPGTNWQVRVEGVTYYVESINHDGRRWTTLNIYRDGR